MSKKEKLLARIRQNPNNVRFSELESVLNEAGYWAVDNGTRDVVFKRKGSLPITVPKRVPFLLSVYVKKALKCIDNE